MTARQEPARFYLPVTVELLRRARAAGRFGPAPLHGHAVTALLVAAATAELGAEPEEEELEHAASTAAAQDSVQLLGPDDAPRRMVAAFGVPAAQLEGTDGDEPGRATVSVEVAWRRLASVLVDGPDAAGAVAAARAALASGDPGADGLVDDCLDHELGWYAVQELPELLGLPGR